MKRPCSVKIVRELGWLLAAVPPAWLTKDPLVISSHHLLRGSAEAVIWQSSLSTLLCSLHSTLHTVTGPCSSHHTSASSGKWTRRCVVTGQWTRGWHWTAGTGLAYWPFRAPNFWISKYLKSWLESRAVWKCSNKAPVYSTREEDGGG